MIFVVFSSRVRETFSFGLNVLLSMYNSEKSFVFWNTYYLLFTANRTISLSFTVSSDKNMSDLSRVRVILMTKGNRINV